MRFVILPLSPCPADGALLVWVCLGFANACLPSSSPVRVLMIRCQTSTATLSCAKPGRTTIVQLLACRNGNCSAQKSPQKSSCNSAHNESRCDAACATCSLRHCSVCRPSSHTRSRASASAPRSRSNKRQPCPVSMVCEDATVQERGRRCAFPLQAVFGDVGSTDLHQCYIRPARPERTGGAHAQQAIAAAQGLQCQAWSETAEGDAAPAFISRRNERATRQDRHTGMSCRGPATQRNSRRRNR